MYFNTQNVVKTSSIYKLQKKDRNPILAKGGGEGRETKVLRMNVPNFTKELMKVVDGPLDSMKQRRVF